jgi:hypothetical protein
MIHRDQKDPPMTNARRSIPALLLFLILPAARAFGDDRVAATIESTLKTHDRQIRQFALDGDESTFFATEKVPSADEHFTIVLDKPVKLKSVEVKTGRPDGKDKIAGGSLEVSTDGKSFRKLAGFAEGSARGEAVSEPIRAIRIKPEESKEPIAIRELAIASEPAVEVFKYPVEIEVNVTDAPELKEWAEKTARICEKSYLMINEELKSDGYKPPHYIRMTLSKSYRGVAATMRDRIVGNVKWFTDHPGDIGAMVHEVTHVVQAYPRGNKPGWLQEGISDYVRFFKYEPGKIGRIPAQTSHYDQSYRRSAAFLAYLVDKYDKEIILKLNAALREGKYEDNMFIRLTGKPLGELDDEWRATLKP